MKYWFTKKQIKIVIITGVLLFFAVLFIYNLAKMQVFKEDSIKVNVLNDRIVFTQPKLAIFDSTEYLNQFPDTIHIHYPYIIVVIPENRSDISTVYNTSAKKQIAAFNDIVLDYDKGAFLYNYHGGNTFYNGKDLKVHCNQGFIKSDIDILCVTQNEANPLFSVLMSINPKTLTQKTLYSPQNAITAVYFENNTLYLGEYNYTTHQVYLTINGTRSKISTFVSIIYPMKNNIYIGTFKNDEAELQASYAQVINKEGKPSSRVLSKGKIVFYD